MALKKSSPWRNDGSEQSAPTVLGRIDPPHLQEMTTFRTLRFGGVRSRLMYNAEKTEQWLEIDVPTNPMPSGLIDEIRKTGLSESQTDEIVCKIDDILVMNYLRDSMMRD